MAEKRRSGRTVTMTLEDRWVQVKAAERETSVLQLVADLERDAYDAAMRTMFAIVKPVMFEKPGGRFPTRDEIYDRPKRWL